MKKPLLVIAALFFSHLSESYAQTDSLKAYVTEALNLMKERSVNKKKVDWESLYASALAKTDTARSLRGTYPIIEEALGQLQDKHSKFFPPEVIAAYNKGYRALGMPFPKPEARMIEGKYAYISVPAFYVNHLEEQREYATSIQAALQQLDAQKPQGWIIDLRRNDGGMSNPMLAGIGSFIENEKSAGWKNADGKATFWVYRKGKVYEGGNLVFDLASKPYVVKSRKKPVSVLVSRNSASAAEVVAMAFVGRKNTRLIGTNTNGLTSANDAHKLSDGAYLVLTEGNYIDRTQKEYAKVGEGIAADIPVGKLSKDKEENDRVYLQKAVEYLSAGSK
ncbi:S41 family peptidase [Rufibacter psychrotolerans]|uniref:S41 family peptidase n=1 Tax=Rufibacter psychrotolerans TaxID=2812556 RepID=UPI001968455D|nr:S41 family peptidase [Rufibacter sp. SYSU D00308]